MVEIDPYHDDLFRKIIEQRRLHKADKALSYWLKILANSIYGLFGELNPDALSKKAPVNVFSGEKNFPDASNVIENPGGWFFPPLASLITAGGRLLLAMTEACVQEKKGSYLFCDTDSLAVVSSKHGGPLRIPGSKGLRILSWKRSARHWDKFESLNPYDRQIVKKSILNPVDANHVDSDPGVDWNATGSRTARSGKGQARFVSFCSEKFLFCFATAVLIFFIVGLLYLLRSKRVDNLGAYRIPPETGLLIPSDFVNDLEVPFGTDCSIELH
jgi:hypothetical protein